MDGEREVEELPLRVLLPWWQRLWRVAALRTLAYALLVVVMVGPFLTVAWYYWRVEQDRHARAEGVQAAVVDPSPAWFAPGESFPPLAMQWRSSWLSVHHEPGQSFGQYTWRRSIMPREGWRRVYLLPIGEIDKDLLDTRALIEVVEAYVGLPVIMLEPWTPDASVGTRELQGKTQWYIPDLMPHLEAKMPADAYALMGITMRDITPGGDYNFVFGQASPGKRIGVQSLARYDPLFHGREVNLLRSGREVTLERRRALVWERTVSVLTHEIGHLMGLRHCINYACNMNGSNSLFESDSQPLHLCPECLRKMQHAALFDPRQRYQRLARLYEESGLTFDADWCRERIAEVDRALKESGD